MTDAGYLPPEESELPENRIAELHRTPQFEEGKRKKLGVFFWICIGYIVILAVATFAANLLHIQNPNTIPFTNEFAHPTLAHWFGTDENGRDIFARVLYGGRVSMQAGAGAMVIAFSIGGTLGMFAAYRRGRFDVLMSALMYTVLAFPSIIVVISLLGLWPPHNLYKVVIVLGGTSIPIVYRVIRGATLSVATRDFVMAAKIQGATNRRIILRELLPNVAPIGLSFLLIGIAVTIGAEGGLSFLGFSVDPTVTPSWGNMINESRGYLTQDPWLALFPSLAICSFLLALNFAGDRLRSFFEITDLKL